MSTLLGKQGSIFIALLLAGWISASNSNATDKEALPIERGPYILYHSAAQRVLDIGFEPEVLSSGFIWAEGPLWLPEQGCLIFSDIPNNKVMRYCPKSGLDVYLSESGYSNGLILDHDQRLILLQSRNRKVAKMVSPLTKPEPNYEVLVSHFEGRKLNSPNDGIIDTKGNIYFTDPPYGLAQQLKDPRKELPYQGVYRLNKEGTIDLLDSSLTFPNGLTMIAGETKLLVAVSDPDNPSWYSYDVDDQGDLINRRLFASAKNYELERDDVGLPDGLKEHVSGFIFATGPGGVWVFRNDSTLLARIMIDGPVANLTFNTAQDTLYLTAESKLMHIKLKRKGFKTAIN